MIVMKGLSKLLRIYSILGGIIILLILSCYYSDLSSFIKISSKNSSNRQLEKIDFNTKKFCSGKKSEEIKSYCDRKRINCMDHDANVDEDLLQHSTSADEEQQNDNNNEQKGCKTLWFAAVYESDTLCRIEDNINEHKYNLDYSLALNSMIENANESLQPVLILGRYGTIYENTNYHKHFGRWAIKKGVKVIYSSKLSFQDDVNFGLPAYVQENFYSQLQGPFLRLDVPKFIKEYNLFDIPNVCQDHILYTDADIIFANKITRNNIKTLITSMGSASMSYGREYMKLPTIANTGVMIINVEKFEQDVTKILELARNEAKYPTNDQQMLNNYQRRQSNPAEIFKMLPMHYNWKPYWKLEPSTFSQVKILHFHGAKPGRGLEKIATCDIDAVSQAVEGAYRGHMDQGICCDGGRTAAWAVNTLSLLSVPFYELCDLGVDGFRETMNYEYVQPKRAKIVEKTYNKNANYMDQIEAFMSQ